MKVGRDIERVVVDTPAGLSGSDLYHRINEADTVIVPILPSHIDIHAAAQFIDELQVTGCFRDQTRRLMVVANRVRKNTLMYRELAEYLKERGLPNIVCLRDAQIYLKTQSVGLGIADLSDKVAKKDKAIWNRFASYAERRVQASLPSTSAKADLTS